MIKINKGTAPQELIDAKKELDKIHNEAFDLNSQDYLTAVRIFDFTKTKAYRSPIVRAALKQIQHNKCCFSEAKFTGDDFHVEHFRPKGRVDEWPKGNQYYPGYYWLVYEWTNLFLCKSTINTSAKRNFFPIEDENFRNRSHNDTKAEVALFVDPSADEPRDHIIFIGDEPVGITVKGKATINILRLRSPEFEEARRTKLQLLTSLRNAVDLLIQQGIPTNDPRMTDFLVSLKYAVSDEAEFSSMAKDFLSTWPPLQ